MSKVFVALAASVDGYITGPDPNPDRPLGIGGGQLFDWYRDGDTPSAQYPNFRLSAPSAQVFDALVDRVGAVVAGRKTYDDSDGWDGEGQHPTAALFVLSHRPAPPGATRQTFVGGDFRRHRGSDASRWRSGRGADGTRCSRCGATGRVGGRGDHPSSASTARRRCQLLRDMTGKVQLSRLGVVAAPGVTHLSYAVVR